MFNRKEFIAMVRHFSLPDDYDFESESDPGPQLSLRKPEQDAEDKLSMSLDLAQAFLRFRKSHQRLGFKRLLSLWVSHRLKLNLPVDDIDPDEQAPSESFVSFLKVKFDEAKER